MVEVDMDIVTRSFTVLIVLVRSLRLRLMMKTGTMTDVVETNTGDYISVEDLEEGDWFIVLTGTTWLMLENIEQN
jgi:hypothetical protein